MMPLCLFSVFVVINSFGVPKEYHTPNLQGFCVVPPNELTIAYTHLEQVRRELVMTLGVYEYTIPLPQAPGEYLFSYAPGRRRAKYQRQAIVDPARVPGSNIVDEQWAKIPVKIGRRGMN